MEVDRLCERDGMGKKKKKKVEGNFFGFQSAVKCKGKSKKVIKNLRQWNAFSKT